MAQVNGFGMTDPGRVRTKNDDFYLVERDLGLYIVCDGVSGNAGGSEASRLAAELTRDHVRDNAAVLRECEQEPTRIRCNRVLELLERAVQKAGAKIHEIAQREPSHTGMCTTLDLLVVCGSNAFTAHVGDSRIYLVREGKIHCLTEDHSYSAEMVRSAKWTPEQAAQSPYSNVLTRALGKWAAVQIDYLQLELRPGDRFLICSDGLSRYFKDDELLQKVSGSDPSQLPADLISISKERGGKDNITAVLVQFGEPQRAPERSKIAGAAIDPMKKMELLGKISIFRYLTYTERTKVLASAQLQNFATSDEIAAEGSEGDCMYIVASGRVGVVKGGQVVAERGVGELIGEMSLIDNSPRSASLIAAEPSMLLMIQRSDLFSLLKTESSLAVKLLWALAGELNLRLRSTTEKLIERSVPPGDVPFR